MPQGDSASWERWIPWIAGAIGVGAVAWLIGRSLNPTTVPLPSGTNGMIGAGGGSGITGTIYTILLENKSASQVLGSSRMPFFNQLASEYGQATNYRSPYHPSLPNYLVLTSGQTWGVTDDNYHSIPGTQNLFAQMNAAGIPWRAYAESMNTPCRTSDSYLYASRHNPAVYYQSNTGDPGTCAQNVVDFSNFASDAASGAYRYMWITPNLQNDMHDGTPEQADAWLSQVIPQIMATPGYQNGGAIFILFDEGGGGRDPNKLAAMVISPRLQSFPIQDSTPYDHRSYVATVQDSLGLPRLPATANSQNMLGMFR
jgi:acid phosphatase